MFGDYRGIFGGGSDTTYIIGLIIVFLVISKLFANRSPGLRISGPALVLKKFRVNEFDQDGVLVDIAGRAPGFFSWLLTAMGFEADTSLTLYRDRVFFHSAGLYGERNEIVPITCISGTSCGYSKPIGYLVVGVFLAGGSLLTEIFMRRSNGAAFLVGLFIGAIFLIAYSLSKKITINLETFGGTWFGLTFKRSMIENVPIDIQKTLEAISIINNRILLAQQAGRPSEPVQAAPPLAPKPAPNLDPAPSPRPPVTSCDRCGRQYPGNLSGRFCEECGARLSRVI
ncbi:MAG: hypothetical protein HZB23_06255 [Deltaproteobacteria bacterium]|nr:hypothetical protein [Deltaproteobacteria bacterium]